MSSSAKWSDLPPDLLHAISTRLPSYLSFLRLRAVSRHFHSSVPATTLLRPQLPWLLLPHTTTSTTIPLRRAFLDLSLNKFHFLPGPDPSNRRRCCGSSHGWLIILDEYPTIMLLNALTADKVYLPALSTFSNVISLDFSNVGREYTLRNSRSGIVYNLSLWKMRDTFVKKIVLSSSPRNCKGFVAMAILSLSGELAYCKNGEKEWRILEGVEGCCEDVIYWNGLFYAVDKMGCVMACDLTRERPEVRVLETARRYGGDLHYLVGFEGELLFVSRFLDMVYDEEVDLPEVMYKTVRFEVWRMDLGGDNVWEKVTSLGDKVLFLGGNSSICLLASDFDGCKKDCIYFTDDYSETNYDGFWGDFDMGIYNLADGEMEPLMSCPRNSKTGLRWPSPIWVTPSPI